MRTEKKKGEANAKNTFRKGIGLNAKLIGLLLPIIAVTLGAILLLVYANTSKMILANSEENLQLSTASVINNVNAWTNRVLTALEQQRDAIEFFDFGDVNQTAAASDAAADTAEGDGAADATDAAQPDGDGAAATEATTGTETADTGEADAADDTAAATDAAQPDNAADADANDAAETVPAADTQAPQATAAQEDDTELAYIKHTANQYDAYPAGIYLGLTDGSLRHASFVPGPEYNVFEKSWYKDGLQSEDFILGAIYFDEDSQSYVVGASGVLKSKSGEVRGVAAADIYLTDISKIVAEVQLEQTGGMLLVD